MPDAAGRGKKRKLFVTKLGFWIVRVGKEANSLVQLELNSGSPCRCYNYVDFFFFFGMFERLPCNLSSVCLLKKS